MGRGGASLAPAQKVERGRSRRPGSARAREGGARRGGCQRRVHRGQRRVHSVRSSDLTAKLPLFPIKSDQPDLYVNLAFPLQISGVNC